MDNWARKLWYAKRGLVADEQKSYSAWALANVASRDEARAEVERVLGNYIAEQLNAALLSVHNGNG